jgi:hypothetical protein
MKLSPIFVSRKSLLFLCLSVASVVLLPQNLEAATIIENDWPVETGTASTAGIRGQQIINSEDVSATGTAKYLEMWVVGTNVTNELVIEFDVVDGSATDSDYTCRTLAGQTGQDYGLIDGTPQKITFELEENTANGCDITTSTESGTDLSIGSGSGYSHLTNNNDGDIAAVIYTEEGQTISSVSTFDSGFNSINDTRFLTLDITGTSTINLETSYYLDEDEVDPSISSRNPTIVNFEYALSPSTTFSVRGESISNTTFGTSTVSTNISSLSDGTYDVLIRFSNAGVLFGGDRPFPDSYIYTDFTVSGGVLSATGTQEFYDATTFNDISNTGYKPCSLTQFTGCLQNLIIWLFVPNQFSTEYFELVKTELETKVPFAYIFAVTDQVEIIQSGSGTLPSITLNAWGDFNSVTILNPDWFTTGNWATVFTTVKALSTMAIWGTFVLVLYRRSKYYLSSISNAE